MVVDIGKPILYYNGVPQRYTNSLHFLTERTQKWTEMKSMKS